MTKQLENSLAPTQATSGARALRWLRARLLPQGDSVMMVVAYAMILTALISFIVLHPAQLAPWRFYAAVLALAALLVLNVVLHDLEVWLGQRRAVRIFFAGSAGLFLLANLLGGFSQFFPFLLFMLAAQAFVIMRWAWASAYTLALAAGWHALLWLGGITLGNLIGTAVQISLGLFFTAIFALVISRYGQQTARAELLAQNLQAANAELAAAREREMALAAAEERVRLAREIHDGLGHHLTVLNVQLQAAGKLVGRDPDRAANAIALAREEAQAALDEVRRSVAALRRTPLDGRTLDQALGALVRDFARRSAISAHFELRGAPAELAPAAAVSLYRAAQEGLTNVQKYAGARRVDVQLDFGQASVRLRVLDDGAGTPEPVGQGGGFGLLGLRERAEQLGGDFSAGPRENGGFLLELALPIAARAPLV